MSIRTRLLLLAIAVTLLAALFVGWRFMQDRERDIAGVTQRLPAIAAGVAEDLSERVQGTEQLHFGLSRARDLDTSDRAPCSAFLSKVRDKYPQYTGILTLDPAGHLVCDSLRSGRELDVSDRAYFKRALLLTDAITLQAAFGRLSQLAVLQVAYPVRAPDGELKFILLASLSLDQVVKSAWEAAQMPGVEVMLVNRAGLVMASAGGAARQRQAGSSIAGQELLRFAMEPASAPPREIANPDGTPQVWAVSHSPVTREADLVILAGYPKELLVAAANRRFVEDLAVLAIMATLAFLGIWFFAELAIRRPIATIAAMVTRLGNHDSGARIPAPFPRGELGVLMQTLNQSAQAQDDQRATLDALQARLRETQRLEAIGQLTGGVAHDFNNLLTVILGNAEVLNEQLRDSPRLASMAAMVLDAAARGADLTQRLLAFARKQALVPQAVNISRLVEGMAPLLRRTLGEHIDIRFSSGTQLWRAQIDPAQLDNALLNLCINSRDAMPDGGQLTIETENVTLDADYANCHADVLAGDYVMLAVSDTGTGIPPGIRDRVFEPFFTTKEQGKGTGLGMAMVHGFLKQSGGHVALYSEMGLGTTLKLYLPRATVASQGPTKAPAGAAVAGGSETILLVEDDAMVRRYAHEQLVSLGYRVIEADCAAQALDVIRTRVHFDLLFTDVVMPGISGAALAKEARELHPELKVLFTSGYTDNALVHNGRLDEGVRLLSKPYRREDLARVIREALESSPAEGIAA